LTYAPKLAKTFEPPSFLEHWYREHLRNAQIDISSSGVSPYTLRDFEELTGFSVRDLQGIATDNSESFGSMGLRVAIAERYAGGDTTRVMVTHGSNEAIFLALSALAAPGVKVAHVDPIYHSLRSTPVRLGAEMVPLPIELFMGSCPQWDVLEKLIDDDTDIVVVNFPHNPTGINLKIKDAHRLAHLCNRRRAILVWDAVFEHLTTGEEVPGNLGGVYHNSVVFGTMSKAYGLPELRVGWCVAPPWLLDRALSLRDSTTLFFSPIMEELARVAVKNAPKLVVPRLDRALVNLKHLRQWVNSEERVTWVEPDAGVCCQLSFVGHQDSESFCRNLFKRHGVLLVPGNAFGSGDGVRLGFGGPTEEFVEGLCRVRSYLDFLDDCGPQS
jgi:capreomycidine synthase